MNDAGEHTASVQQIGYGAERCRRNYVRCCGGIQVSPDRWNEGPRTVRQDEHQIQLAVAPHPTQQRECLAFQWVAGSNNCDRGRIALEVGSVLPFRLTRWTTSGWYGCWSTELPTDGSSV